MRLLEWFRRRDIERSYEQRIHGLEKYLAELPEHERVDVIAAAQERQEALERLGIAHAFSCRRSASFPTAEEIRRDTESIIESARRNNAAIEYTAAHQSITSSRSGHSD